MMRRYLPSVLRCSTMEGVEVVVADNASTDDSVEMLRRDFPQVRLIQLDQNYGFAEGYNRALAELPDSTYYLLLNSDVEVRQEGWLRPLLQYMDAHPECAACQPKLLSLRHPADFEYAGAAGGFLDCFGYPYCRGRVMQTVEKDEGQYDEMRPLLWATGAALMVRADDFREAGGLDGRFFAHMEEIDLCWRLRLLGRSIVCVSASTAYHLGGATLEQGNPRKTFFNFRNSLMMLYKNLPEDRLAAVMGWRKALDYVAALQFLLKRDWANAKAVLHARRDFLRIRPQLEADRLRIQQRAGEHDESLLAPFSILWQYYGRGRKTFSSLPHY